MIPPHQVAADDQARAAAYDTVTALAALIRAHRSLCTMPGCIGTDAYLLLARMCTHQRDSLLVAALLTLAGPTPPGELGGVPAVRHG